MPNWAEGNVRFRGKRENLIHFLTNELVWPVYDADKITYHEVPVTLRQTPDGCAVEIIRRENHDGTMYFRGSNRQFVDADDFEYYFEFSDGINENKDQIVIFTGYKAAWNVDYGYFKAKAEKYRIDIRTFVWEEGLEWSSIVTWYRNGKMEEQTRTYSDWLWDSSMPYYGG